MKTQIETLAETVISMSTDFLLGKISKELQYKSLNKKDFINYISFYLKMIILESSVTLPKLLIVCLGTGSNYLK